MKVLKVKKNRKLFDEWNDTIDGLHIYGGGLVQNDMELNTDQLNEIYIKINQLVKQSIILRNETFKYIKDINNIDSDK